MPENGTASEADLTDKPHLGASPEPSAAVNRALAEVQRQRAESLRATDRELGRVLRTLQETGQLSRTVIAFTSDNGYLMGEHRLRMQKIWAYDESLRVPLLVAGPGIRRGVRHAPAMTHDLSATVLDLAGAGHLRGGSGRSLLPVRCAARTGRGTGPCSVRYWPSMRQRFHLPAGLSTAGLRTGRGSSSASPTAPSSSDDLAPPAEMDNLARRPEFREVRDRLGQVWESYASCSGAACRTRLPADLVVAPGELRRIAANADAARREHYGPPTRR